MISLKELNSIISKAKEIDVKAVYTGIKNFYHPKPEVEALAKERKGECINCDDFVDLAKNAKIITDNSIGELTNKKCGQCQCISSFKLRQSIKVCDKWQK